MMFGKQVKNPQSHNEIVIILENTSNKAQHLHKAFLYTENKTKSLGLNFHVYMFYYYNSKK